MYRRSNMGASHILQEFKKKHNRLEVYDVQTVINNVYYIYKEGDEWIHAIIKHGDRVIMANVTERISIT